MKLLPPTVFLRAFCTAATRLATSTRDLQSRGLRIGTAVLIAATALPALAALPVDRIKVPPGFRIEVLSNAVPSARAMALSPKGILYIGSLDGHVYALELQNGRVTARHVIASGLETPAGVAWHDGALYVSAVSKIVRFDAIDTHLNDPSKPVVVIDTLPAETHHGWKFIAFGPDGKLYVPQGAPCNVCLKDRNRFGLIGRMDPDGSHYEVVARGIRNSVGFAWHPVTHDLWFTDNGRDLLGDDVPDDKLNRAPRAGMDFGFPYCHGGDTPDPEFGKDHPCSAFTPPAVKLGAHVAALGMRFYDGPMFPATYRNSIFIAEHGSWNRSKKVGYRVVHVTTDPDGSNARQEVFAEGWLQSGETEWGRPADVLPLPDGSLLISDDYAGAVYRVTYSAP
ncbi:PQQ-dependent sugar dehydrogenase [Paraburkholderia phytofirmans]|uniref:Putative membrane-bound dehydrogenase n=1 Tax=Paraburkholderia phytofirmans (strain DSM 17436 / LMG 22146 / PsJN) TaxID=398527 RepID=B2T608_PARPJ|nr:sorbosone dehydrogenase family protein [Paraburkholderia phytofirmans]ACD17372.1 putative membrane-bound dehydrogenase [Paraburkholderia phytofirmans PsJN]